MLNKKWNFKNKILILSIMLLSMILIPLLSVCGENNITSLKSSITEKLESKKSNKLNNSFCVLDEATNEIVKIPDKEFLCGVVASEMPALFEEEALKAQAVASYTFFCRERNKFINLKNPDKKYEFTVNSYKGLNYLSKEQMKIRWGNNFEKFYNKIENCIDSVFPEVIEDDGDLMLAAYHAISSGETEKSEDVFGGELKYLTNVESPGDKLAKGYESKAEIPLEIFKEKILKECKECKFSGNPSEWVKDISRTKGGMIKDITIDSFKTTGKQIRSIFNLRSADFEIFYDNEGSKFVFTVHGYGHGVGMSQSGAQYMAKQGSDYKQILSWYYPNTSVVPLNKVD